MTATPQTGRAPPPPGTRSRTGVTDRHRARGAAWTKTHPRPRSLAGLVPPGQVEVRHDGQHGLCLAFGPPRYVTTELIRVGYRG
jgi:hypothetical protein